MGDETYIYGDANGQSYLDLDGDTDLPRRTHWDPRMEIKVLAGMVQVGVIPASERSSDEGGLWNPEDGQFLTMSRDGINRAIAALRRARDEAYGRDE